MTALSDLLKTKIAITTHIHFADSDGDTISNYGFDYGGCTIEAGYKLDDTFIRLQASGICGETANGQFVDVGPGMMFDDFCHVHFSNVDNMLSGTFFLNEMGKVFENLAKEHPNKDLHPLAKVIDKMGTALYKLSSNAKLLNKHPKKFHYPKPL